MPSDVSTKRVARSGRVSLAGDSGSLVPSRRPCSEPHPREWLPSGGASAPAPASGANCGWCLSSSSCISYSPFSRLSRRGFGAWDQAMRDCPKRVAEFFRTLRNTNKMADKGLVLMREKFFCAHSHVHSLGFNPICRTLTGGRGGIFHHSKKFWHSCVCARFYTQKWTGKVPPKN